MAEEVVKTIENVDKLFSEIVVNGEVHKSNRYTSPSVQSASPSSVRSTQGEDVHAVELNDILHNFSDPDVVLDVQTLQQGLTNETNARYNADQNLQGQIDTVGGNVSTLQGKVNTIESEIPAQASSQNQLADKNFVNSSISTNTANFLGTYTSMADIEAIPNPTNNDYVFLQTTDSAGNNVFSRYKYNAEQDEWLYEYELNNSSFTAEQWATINSGLTQSSVSQEIEDAIGQYVYNSFLPTDAVLHYSFDEVPDYPDGSADVRLLNNNTYDIQSGNYKFISNGGATISNANGNVKVVIVGGSSTGVNISGSYIMGKILKFKLNVSELTGRLIVFNGISTPIKYIENVGTYEISYIHNNTEPTYSQLFILCNGSGNSCTFTVEQIYIGNGSYTTPVIDNANGENNGTNNGGIAVQGLSGKGAYFLNGKYVSISNINLTPDFTVSVWVKPDNSTNGLIGNILTKNNQILLQNGTVYVNNLSLSIRQNDAYTTTNIGEKLTANVWTHLVITKSGANVKVFRNAVLTQIATLPSSVLDQNNDPIYLCGGQNTRPQTLDDVLIFNRALSQEEVTALYFNRANTPKYFPQPTAKIEQNNWGLATSGGVATALNDYQSKDYINLSSNDANDVGEGIYNCYRVSANCANIPVARIGLLTSYKYVSGQYIRITQEYSTNDNAVSTAEKYIRWGMSNNSGTSYDWSVWTKCSLPSPPSTDGKYNLQCAVASGVPSYNWVTRDYQLVLDLLVHTSNVNFTVHTTDTGQVAVGTYTPQRDISCYFIYWQDNVLTGDTRNTPLYVVDGVNVFQSASENFNLARGVKAWKVNLTANKTYTFQLWCHSPSVDCNFSNFRLLPDLA